MGRYSQADRELIEQFINRLHELVSGDRSPSSALQKRFVEVIRNRLPAEDDYQSAYQNWVADNPSVFEKLVGNRESEWPFPSRPVHASGLSRRASRGLPSANSEWEREQEARRIANAKRRAEEEENERKKAELAAKLPKEQPGKPTENFRRRRIAEPWGSREAWKKDRGSWRR